MLHHSKVNAEVIYSQLQSWQAIQAAASSGKHRGCIISQIRSCPHYITWHFNVSLLRYISTDCADLGDYTIPEGVVCGQYNLKDCWHLCTVDIYVTAAFKLLRVTLFCIFYCLCDLWYECSCVCICVCFNSSLNTTQTILTSDETHFINM